MAQVAELTERQKSPALLQRVQRSSLNDMPQPVKRSLPQMHSNQTGTKMEKENKANYVLRFV